MSDTTYIDYVQPAVSAEWLNEINDHVWHDTAVIDATVHNAANIKNTPAGTISSTNVQAALNELDTDKLNTLFTQIGTGAVSRTYSSKVGESFSVKDFGAIGNGITDDTSAIQATINAVNVAGGGEVFFPRGTYKITSALVMDTGIYTQGISLRGVGRNSIISQTGAGQDAIKFSTTQFLQNSSLRDLQIITSATAGHCVNIVYGCTCCVFDNIEMAVGNTSKACVYGDYTTFGGGIYDTQFRGGSWYCASAATEAGFRVIAKGTIFNENVFENLRCYNATGTQFFKITTATTANIWLINNTWKNINFETCKGGGFAFDSFKNCKIENVSFWDAGGAYTGHLISMLSGVGYESSANTLINVGRNGDSLSGCKDINIAAGQDTVFINCYTQVGDSPAYELGNKRVTIIGKLFGTITNFANMMVINGIDGIRFVGTINGAPLSYYDEGTWIATLTGSTAAPTVPVKSTGRWTRIGRVVTVQVIFSNVTTTGATGQIQITGLPFTVGSVNAMGLVGLSGLGANSAVGIAAAGSTVVGFVQAASIGAVLSYGAGTGQFVYLNMEYTV